MKGVRLRRKEPGANVARIGLDGLAQRRANGAVAAVVLEFTRGDPCEIVDDEHLSVRRRAGADADRRRADRLRDPRRELLRHELQHHKLLSGGVERQRVVIEFRGGLRRLALAPLHVVMLRFEAEMSAHVEAGRRQGAHDFGLRAFEFHAIGASLAQQARTFDRLLGRVIGRIGQIADDVDLGRAAPHRGDVMRHIGERHLALMRIAQNIHPDAVADEYNVDAGLRLDARGRRVIGGDDHDLLASALHVEEGAGVGQMGLRRA